MAAYQIAPAAGRVAQYAAPVIGAASAPPGTFAPGTKVQVGSHRVVIEKYLSEGGFAHVYVVRLPGPKNETAVLKRVAVPDKENLASMRTEVETMKKLKGHKHIVTYIDSHASQLKGGGYEVFLLMEYCSGGGLIDFMNTRLKNRLTEPEILEIFSDAAEGVACMHYLKPPLLHRDLKVENILISKTGTSRKYKLCDFGSTAPPRPAASSAAEGRLIEDDVQRHTTLQYRSPEMIDVYRKKPIDEKSDVWALGVLLYKLCYYTTPFEEQGQMAILSASFKYPAYPHFSDKLKLLIAKLLQDDPQRRPNIYQIIKEVCMMRGKEVPIKDIYAERTHSEARAHQQLPPREPNVKSPPVAGAVIAAPEEPKQYIPDVVPMRRGRPTAPGQQGTPGRPSPSPGKKAEGDPFAALDSKDYKTRVAAVDELSGRFPALDDFSLLKTKDDKFQFSSGTPKDSKTPDLSQRVTNALADEAFGKKSTPPGPTASKTIATRTEPVSSAQTSRHSSRPSQTMTQPTPQVQEPLPQRPSMVSTGTMTSRPSSPQGSKAKDIKVTEPIKVTDPKPPSFDNRPVWKVPDRSDSPRLSAISRFDSLAANQSNLRSLSRSPLNYDEGAMPRSPSSARPSLEGLRPATNDLAEHIQRSRSAHARPHLTGNRTPTSEYPPRRESLFRRISQKESKRMSTEIQPDSSDESNIQSDMDFLRAKEEEESSKGHHRRSSSFMQIKRASLPSLTGTKNILSGKIGDTLRRFEGGSRHTSRSQEAESAVDLENDNREPVDIEDSAIDETEDLSPEMRRELERRQLEQEERRVENAAAAYRQRLAANGDASGRPNRASAIQDRVKNLLDESGRVSPVKKTASGYGRFTEAPEPTPPQSQPLETRRAPPPSVARKPILPSAPTSASAPPAGEMPHRAATVAITSANALPSGTAAASQLNKPLPLRPSAPPKPTALRTGGQTPTISQQPLDAGRVPVQRTTPVVAMSDDAVPNSAEWEENFSKRYPSLSLEMVETEIAQSKVPSSNGRKRLSGTGLRIKDDT